LVQENLFTTLESNLANRTNALSDSDSIQTPATPTVDDVQVFLQSLVSSSNEREARQHIIDTAEEPIFQLLFIAMVLLL